MDILKKFFPFSFKYNDSVANLIVGIIIYVVGAVVAGAIIWLAALIAGWIPFIGGLIGWALSLLGTLVEVYVAAGIVILVLSFLKILK